jgi:Uma2 family endonuclease
MVVRMRFSVDRYEAMIRGGILTENDRVELLHGEIVEKMPIGPHHLACVNRLNRHLQRLAGDRAIVSVQNPIRLEDSEPEPDVALLRPRPDDYAAATPGPADVFLVIEVADTSLDDDRTTKAPLYAANGIREYWIVDLNDGAIEVRRQPRPDGSWGEQRVCRPDERLEVQALPGVALDVAAVLGGGPTPPA